MESLVGSIVAGYTLSAKVGEGGTSTVYRAEHPVHGRVALKILRDKLRHDRTAVERFLREAAFGRRVQHPNIVKTLDVGHQTEQDRHYLAIDWASGELLERYADSRGPLPASEVALIMKQLCAAVQATHDAGIVHRDLKPENVMYDASSGHVMLLDFGIAADTDSTPDQRLTRAGFFVGTLMYVAPEALSGELVTPAADQYSLATIAYYLLTNALPYSGRTPRELFSQLLTQPPVGLNRVKPGLHFAPNLESVIMRALSRSPAERFPTVAAFASAIEYAVLNPEPIDVSKFERPVSVTETPQKAPESSGILGKVRDLFRRN